MSARDTLVTALRDVIPDTWHIVDVASNLDVVGGTVVTVSQRAVGSFPQAPIAKVEVEFELEVITKFDGKVAAERTLDEAVVQLLVAFRTLRLRFERAEKNVDADRLGYRIPVYVHASKE